MERGAIMTRQVEQSELKDRIEELLAQVRRGDDVVISDHGEVVAKLVPAEQAKPAVGRRVAGSAKGKFWMSDDFDDPLPPDLLEAFEK
jgi:prevent-host-death family protein